MTDRDRGAQPPLEFIPPALNPLVLGGCRILLPLWLSGKTNLVKIEGDRVEALATYYQQFQQGKIRFLMAFRHPSINDPFCMAHLLWKLVPQVARQQKIALKNPIHAHFIYDRGIPLWAGDEVGWLYSRLGGTPIQRGKTDLMGLRSIRRLFAEGKLPIAAAPEGATNGHNEIVSPLEPGIAQFSFWCVEDLAKAQRSQKVLIIPIGIQYHYLTPPWSAIAQLLAQLEKETGLSAGATETQIDQTTLYQRLYRLGERLLGLMETFYRDTYHQNIPQISAPETSKEPTLDQANLLLSTRLQTLLNVALQVAEQYFNLPSKGNVSDRCRRLEQAGWDRIYREELKPSHALSSVELGLADRIAEEAELRMWHMRIVETFVAVTGYYVKEKPTVERFAETILLLWDLVSRLKGETAFFRPQLGKQQVKITICNPLSVSDRWQDYQANRRQAVATLTQDLQTSLEETILKSSELY